VVGFVKSALYMCINGRHRQGDCGTHDRLIAE